MSTAHIHDESLHENTSLTANLGANNAYGGISVPSFLRMTLLVALTLSHLFILQERAFGQTTPGGQQLTQSKRFGERLTGFEAFAIEIALDRWQKRHHYTHRQLVHVSLTALHSQHQEYISFHDGTRSSGRSIVYVVERTGRIKIVLSPPPGSGTTLPGEHVAALQAVYAFRKANPSLKHADFFSPNGFGGGVGTLITNGLERYKVGFYERVPPAPPGVVRLGYGYLEEYLIEPQSFAVKRLGIVPGS